MRFILATVLGLAVKAVLGLKTNNMAYSGPFQTNKTKEISDNPKLHATYDLEFTSGVASGDPTTDSLVLWTRLAPKDKSFRDKKGEETMACVEWQVSKDEYMTRVRAKGTAYTSSEVDWNVKISVPNLTRGRRFHYQFKICDSPVKSPRGKAFTLRHKNRGMAFGEVAVGEIFVVTSGAVTERFAPFVYRKIAKRESPRQLIHIGNYINDQDIDMHSPNRSREVQLDTLDDYRRRYASARQNTDLQNAHAQFAWITTWDEGEFAKGAWKNGCAENLNATAWAKRKEAAIRAYYEWMPIRQPDVEDNDRIWRSFEIAKIVDVIVLDSRLYGRDEVDIDPKTLSPEETKNRTILGDKQEAWLFAQLKRSIANKTRWRLIVQPSVFSSFDGALFAEEGHTSDSWDGYTSSRQRLLDFLHDNEIRDTVILSSQARGSFAFDLARGNITGTYDKITGKDALGVEYAIPAAGMGPRGALEPAGWTMKDMFERNDALQYAELTGVGYALVQFDRGSHTTYFQVTREGKEVKMARLEAEKKHSRLRRPLGSGRIKLGESRFNDWKAWSGGEDSGW